MFTTDDPDEGEAFAAARRAAFPAMERVGTLLLEDVGVPVPELPALVHGIREIAAARDTAIVLVAHAGDGNTHPILAYPPGDVAAEARARVAFGEVMDLALSLGGTITGEHGVGRLKAPWLAGAARAGRHGADAADQGRARPRRHPQPGRGPHLRRSAGAARCAAPRQPAVGTVVLNALLCSLPLSAQPQ